MHREYNVIVHKGVDLAELEQELCSSFGSETIPDRPVEICDTRPGSSRITSFNLTDEEAEQLKNDPRILDVEIPPLQQDGMFVGRYVTNQSGNFQRGGSVATDLVNWGLRRGIETTNPYGGSTTVTGDYTYSRDGTGVDFVVMDSGIQADHPEFQDANGNSRVRQIDWYDAAGIVGTMPANFYTDYEGHGTHCAGIAAGKTYGWAKNADIYAMKLNGLEGPTDPGIGISVSLAFDLMRLWHIRKNDPNDPIYTGRPTVVNMSWGYNYQNANDPDSGVYRGTSWTYGVDYTTEPALWAGTGVVPKLNTEVGLRHILPGASSTSDAETSDLVDAGVIVTISAGNNYYKNTLNGDTDYNNSATWGATTRFYHRKGSPWDNNAFYVGNVDQEQVLDTGNYLDVTSDSSTRGPAVNIWSPGTQIMSATSTINDYGSSPVNYPANTSFKIVRISGTSMAAPQIAGIAALHLQANRDFSVADIRDRLLVQDSSNVMYTTGLTDDYNDYTRSLMGATGNVAYSRYYQDVAESLTNVTVSSPSVTTFLNTAAEIDLRGNVSNIAATNLRSVTITSAPSNGTVEQTDPVLGTLTYTPNTDYSGVDSFSYTVENTLGNVSNTGTVSLTVGSGVPVTVADDVAEVEQGSTVLIDVLANDDSANANAATVTISVTPANGTAIAYANGNISYTPNANYYGTDTFKYTVDSTSDVTSGPGNVDVYVTQPVAVANFTANVDTSLGNATIRVLENSTSYDPYFANVGGIYNFASAGTDNRIGTAIMGNIALTLGNISVVSNGGEHDLHALYFEDQGHSGATIDTSYYATNGFFTTGDPWTIEWSQKYEGIGNGQEHILATSAFQTYGALRVFYNSSTTTMNFIFGENGAVKKTFQLTSVPYGEWNKFAISRTGNDVYVYLNGTRVASGTYTAGTGAEFENTFYIGDKSTQSEAGGLYVDNLRFTQGVARYTGDTYPVATQSFPTDNTALANVSTLTISRQPDNGTAFVDFANAAIEYQANEGFTGTDYLEYNVTSINPTTSGNANVTLSVTASLVPTYNNVTVNTATINEDGSNAIFTVNTENVLDGTTVGYTLSGTGITVDDISLASLTGTITITSNVGLLDFNIVADNLTEGNETLVMQLDATDSNGDGTGSIGNVLIINDTSTDPVSYDTAAFNRISSDEDADSGSPTLVRFIVNTTSVTDGTTVGYSLTGAGITVDDISLGSLTGTITINSNTGSVDFYIEEDNLTEGNETLIATLDATDSNGDSTGSLSDSIVLNDTSLDPGVYDSLTVSPTSINEDGSTVTFTVNTTGVLDGTTVNYQITGAGITVDDISLVSLTGAITINSNTGDLSFDINADSFTEGAETLTVTLDASDSQGDATGSLANSVIINDTSTSPAPGTPTYNTVTFDFTDVNEDGTVVAFEIFTTDVLDGTSVGWTISGTGITTDDISLGSLTGSTNIFSNTGALVFSVVEDYTTEGPETLTITLDPTDSNGNVTGSLSASLVINDTSLTPAYNSASFDVSSIDENNTDVATFTVNTENVLDGTTVGYTITGTTVDQISLGSLTGTLTITSDTASFGFTAIEDNTTDGNSTVTVTLDATDSFGTSTGALSDTVDIIDTSLTPVIPPTASDTSVATNRATPVVIQVAPLINDPDGTIISISTGVGSAANGTANPTFISESNVFYTYTPDAEFAGNDVIRYFVTDNDGANSNTANINIQVYAAPTVVDDATTLDENSSVTINVVSNDLAGEFAIDFGTVVIDSGPSNGVAVANSNGTITYTPTIGYFGNDIVSYTVADIVGGVSLPGNVDFTVIQNIITPNIPPVANDDTAFVAINSTTLINVVANDIDTEGGLDISSVAITQAPANGNVIAYANGVVSYTPTIGFAGVDSFLYTVSDFDGGISNNANVTINVLSAPIAVDDNVTIERNTVASIFVPGNDIETDGNLDLTTVQVISGPEFGYANVNTVTGNIDYTPWTNFVGTDSFLYTINDDSGISSGPGNVVITVEFPPPPPDDDGFGTLSTGSSVGVAITAPVNLIDEIVPKFAPELLGRIDNINARVPLSYFYDNPKLAFSFTKTPQQKYIGYNPSKYPSTAVEDRIPIKYSDFVGYLWYFIPFPDPIITASSIGTKTGYTNDGQSTTVSIPYSVDWRQSEWPVPPRIAPTNFRVDVRWYQNNALISTQTNIGSSGTFNSPAIAHGSSEQTISLKAEFHAYLRGPNDDDPQNPNPNVLKTYASNSKQTTGQLVIKPFEVGSTPLVTMNTLKNESVRIDITRRSDDLSVVGYSAGPIRFLGDTDGADYRYPPAPGRSPVNTNYFVWEIQNPTTGAWSDLAFGSIDELSWPQSLPYDGLDGNPNYSGWPVRLKAQAQQNLSNPTEQNYSDISTTADSFVQDIGGYPQTALNFVTSYLEASVDVEVRYDVLKGLPLPGRILIKNQQGTVSYYWRILSIGPHANEFIPNDTGSILNVPPGDVDEVIIRSITPTCSIGEIVDYGYLLEVYTDPGYTEFVASTAFVTIYGTELLKWYNIRYLDRYGVSSPGPQSIDNFDGSYVDTRESAVAEVYILGENLQKELGDNFYVAYSRTSGDTTTATDLQYRLPGSSTWTTVAPGVRFAVPITAASQGVDTGPTVYELFARVFFRFIDDSPAGGLENNFEQFKLDLYEFPSGGSLADSFNIRVYDNYEYFFAVVDSLQVSNPVIELENDVLKTKGSGYIKWTGADIGQSYGSFPWSPYDPDTWGSAVANAGPPYEDRNFGGLYEWQYYDGTWKRLGEIYSPTSTNPTRNLNGDARCVQREDDYFEFKNIDNTIIGGINWANGVPVRCVYRVYYNFNTNPVLIDTKISNTVSLKILTENTEVAIGVTGVNVLTPAETGRYEIRISSSGIIGETVDITTTNNGYWNGISTYRAVAITSDSQTVDLGTFNNQGYYHPDSETETVTVTTRSATTEAVAPYLSASEDFTITNAAPTFTTRAVTKAPGALISSNTNVNVEGSNFNWIVNYKNLPDAYTMRLTVLEITDNGSVISTANWGDYLDGTFDGTDGSGRLYKDITPIYPHTTPASTSQRDKTYTVQNGGMQSLIRPDTAGDITIKVAIAATVPDTRVLAIETFTFTNTTPPPWLEDLNQLLVVANKYSVDEGETVRVYIKDKATSTNPAYDSWNDVTPIPAGTTVYAKVGGSGTDARFEDFTTNPAPTIVANGKTQVIELSIRSDGNAGPVDITFVEGDGVDPNAEGDELFELRCAFNESDLTPATNYAGSGFISVRDTDTPPILNPVASAIPSNFSSGWTYGIISGLIDYSERGARAILQIGKDGMVRTIKNDGSGRLQAAVVRGAWLPEGGSGVASDYEGRIINFSTDFPFQTNRTLVGSYGSTWVNLGTNGVVPLTIGLDASGNYYPIDVVPMARFTVTVQLRKVGGTTISQKQITIDINQEE